MTTSLLFITIVHPLSTGLTLLVQTILVATATGLISNSFWFSYILFLIFLGAMLVLFIYIASIASNEQFSFRAKTSILFITRTFTLFSFILLFSDPILLSNIISTPSSSILLTTDIWPNSSQVSLIYNNPSFLFTIFIVVYLLLTLIVIVKIINVASRPLRISL